MKEITSEIISEQDGGDTGSDDIDPFAHPSLSEIFRARLMYAFTVAAESNNEQVLKYFYDPALIAQITEELVVEWEETLSIENQF